MQHYHLISSGLVSSPVYQLFPPFRSRVSLLFPPDFFFYFSLTHSPSSILIYFYFPFHIIIQFASSHPVRFFRTKILSLRSLPPWISLLLFLLLYILSHFFPCHSFPSSLFSFHPPSSSYFHATRVYSFLYRNPHRAFAILSPVVFTTSIQSYLIWRRLA